MKGDCAMKMKKLALIVVLAVVVALFAVGTVFAQTETTSTPVETTIADILANPVRDQVVTLTGLITQLVEGNDFVLTDSTGSITVGGGPAWFHQLGLVVGQSVTVTGEVDLGKLGQASPTPEIDLFSVASEGKTNTIRQQGGRPPWAGGPNHKGAPAAGGVDDLD
jgi:uncharacterized protein YdeI (BOF family)